MWGSAQPFGRPDIGWTGPDSMCERHTEEMIAIDAIVRAEYPDGRSYDDDSRSRDSASART